MRARRGSLFLAFVALLHARAPLLCAQVQTPPQPAASDSSAPDAKLYTLHIYTNLLQFAVVALHNDLTPLRTLRRDDINVTIDQGPLFHPTQFRIAGEDPLSIAVFLDASGAQSTTVQSAASALAGLVPATLRPHDHVTVYAQDCSLVRTLLDAPASDAAALRRGIENAVAANTLHGGKGRPTCGSTLHLLDGLAFAINDLSHQAGRRVLVIASQGFDHGSTIDFEGLSNRVANASVAVFGLRDQAEFRAALAIHTFTDTSSRAPAAAPGARPVDLLASFANSNGGLVLDTNGRTLPARLRQLVDILRHRYIVEFPRPDDRAAGTHRIDVTVPDFTAIVRSAGASAPIEDSAIRADPSTLPSTPSPARPGAHRSP